MNDRIRELSRILRQRGLEAAEIDTICEFIAYIDGVEEFSEELLDADLPLAYKPRTDWKRSGGH